MKAKIDLSLIILVILSLVLIGYCCIYIINYYGYNDLLVHYPPNHSGGKSLAPNEIGDSIGGILNPVIAFTGAILTFLAFYIQYKSNKLQVILFNRGLAREKAKNKADKLEAKQNEESKHHTNLKILKSLLDSLLGYYDTIGEFLADFIAREKAKPLEPNTMSSTVNSSYSIFQKLEFVALYESVVFHFKDKDEEWETNFISVLNYLEYYDKMILELREKYQIHIDSKFKLLSSVGEEIDREMGDVLLNEKLRELPCLKHYFKIVHHIDENGNSIGNPNEGVDFEALQNDFFKEFLIDIKRLFDDRNDPNYKKTLEKFSIINKRIGTEKFQSVNYVANLEKFYANYFSPDNKFQKRIKDFSNSIYI